MHTIFECNSIEMLWYEIKGLFHLTGENYEMFSHPNLNHLSLALIAQLIYNRIRISPEENKKYTSDKRFIYSHIQYMINRERNVDNKNMLIELLGRLGMG